MAARGGYSVGRRGFTLIEVMVAVILISTVIAAMLQLFADNTRFLGGVEERIDHTLRGSLLLGKADYSFETKERTLYDLADDFELDDALRRRLKATKLSLAYRVEQQLDSGGTVTPAVGEKAPEADDEAVAAVSDAVVLEIGETTFTIGDRRSGWTRMRLQ